MAQAPRVWRVAAQRWGHLAEGQAHRYGVTNGATLLLKIASGESGFKMRAVSSAGARGGTQFMPSTRADYVKRYGVDPWKSPDEAIHATAIFLKTSGLAAYNPGGGQSYIDYILHQPVATVAGKPAGARARAMAPPTFPPPSEPGGLGGELMHLGLVAVLVIGGVAMVGFGVTRMLGTTQRREAT